MLSGCWDSGYWGIQVLEAEFTQSAHWFQITPGWNAMWETKPCWDTNADAGCDLIAASPSMAHALTTTNGALWHPRVYPSANKAIVLLLSQCSVCHLAWDSLQLQLTLCVFVALPWLIDYCPPFQAHGIRKQGWRWRSIQQHSDWTKTNLSHDPYYNIPGLSDTYHRVLSSTWWLESCPIHRHQMRIPSWQLKG